MQFAERQRQPHHNGGIGLSIQNFQSEHSDRVRDLIVASRMFKHPVVAKHLIKNEQLAFLGNGTGAAEVVDLLFNMLISEAWSVFDCWSYACLKANNGETDKESLHSVLESLRLINENDFPDVTTVRMPFEFSIPDSISVRTEQFDIPLMRFAGDALRDWHKNQF
jgi:hypothetical protein